MRTLLVQIDPFFENFLDQPGIFCHFNWHIVPLRGLKMNKMAKTEQENVYNSLYNFCFFVCCCLNAAKLHAGETLSSSYISLAKILFSARTESRIT